MPSLDSGLGSGAPRPAPPVGAVFAFSGVLPPDLLLSAPVSFFRPRVFLAPVPPMSGCAHAVGPPSAFRRLDAEKGFTSSPEGGGVSGSVASISAVSLPISRSRLA